MSNLASFHENNRARNTGDNRSQQNTHLRCLERGAITEGEIGDEQRHGESDATQHSNSNNLTPANTIQHPTNRVRVASHENKTIPIGLPITRPQITPRLTGATTNRAAPPAQGHTRVRQRENRHDEVSVP